MARDEKTAPHLTPPMFCPWKPGKENIPSGCETISNDTRTRRRNTMRTSTFVIQLSATLCGAAALTFAQTPCQNLKSLTIPGVEFSAVETVAAGPYQPPAGAGRGAGGPVAPAGRPIQPQMLPAHCRVAATLRPSTDSDIKMELWLPAENWNGKFQMVGNGGWAGIISFPQMAAALRD